MGHARSSRETFECVAKRLAPDKGRPVTERAEQVAFTTGKLDPLVDPSGYGVIRPSRRMSAAG